MPVVFVLTVTINSVGSAAVYVSVVICLEFLLDGWCATCESRGNGQIMVCFVSVTSVLFLTILSYLYAGVAFND